MKANHKFGYPRAHFLVRTLRIATCSNIFGKNVVRALRFDLFESTEADDKPRKPLENVTDLHKTLDHVNPLDQFGPFEIESLCNFECSESTPYGQRLLLNFEIQGFDGYASFEQL